VLAVLGALATWTFNLRFMAESGGDAGLAAFVAGGYANAASSSLTNDLVVAATVFLVWSYHEARRAGVRHWWLYVVVTFGVAFACAFPLFLLARERALRRARAGALPAA